jgi:uncharacterized protein YeaO (DUF488 family)
MAVRVVRLGSERARDEGLRLGTVRYPPRGVPKSRHASENWFDLWLPDLAPSRDTVKLAQAATTDRHWAAYAKRYRSEMAAPAASRLLQLLSALSRQTNFSVGCYCADETRCHRRLLRELLREHGAEVAS